MHLQIVFWLGIIGVGYTFVGYPVLMRFLNLLRPRKQKELGEAGKSLPSLSIILVVRNEADRIGDRIRNLLECDYSGKRELVLVLDGCEDDTLTQVPEDLEGMELKLVVREESRGKASGLNEGVKKADGEVLVFTDARQRFRSDALLALIQPIMVDPSISGVSGSLEVEPSKEGAAVGVDLYWKLERWIRFEEAKWDSVIGCTGAIYALRRSEFSELPPDTLIDDVVVPMQSLVRGNRILFQPEAVAYDPQTLHPEQEKRRKMRTLAGNYQMLFRYPGWLFPWGNRCFWNLISHKYFRLAGPLFLAASLISALLLAGGSVFFLGILIVQLLCYGLAVVGFLWKSCSLRVVTIPTGFVFLQWQCVRAFGYYLNNCLMGKSGRWE